MIRTRLQPGDPGLAAKLRGAVEGEVRFDALTRGIYATDASHYQVEPLGVVVPKSVDDVRAVLEIAREEGAPVLPRGAGTSQCGQTVGRAIVVDTSRHLTTIEPYRGDGHVEVEPGVVLERLNEALRPHGLWFPVDPSTASRATLGGMAGNDSAGARSLRYGTMADNVTAADVLLADGRRVRLGEGSTAERDMPAELAALRALYAREAEEIARRTPATLRNVAGYALERLVPARENLAKLLVGSEGTLAFFTRLRLALRPLPERRALGVCRFPGLLEALGTVQHIVGLGPSAVELVDRTVLGLARSRPAWRAVLDAVVPGEPGAVLLVELAAEPGEPDPAPRLRDLSRLLAELGFPEAVAPVTEPARQAAVWKVREAGLSIVMAMAGPRKPVSFIEDCAVPLDRLAEYAERVEEIFARHGVRGTWYAHASVGCLHVRPALDLKDPADVDLVRRIAEETHAVVRALGGTHSGEHGDGLLRSEFLRPMLGERMTAAYAEVKRTLDPLGLLNPGKIVDPPRMDERSLFRYHPGYAGRGLPVVLDWSVHGGLLGAVERCDSNGTCRRLRSDVMCPSYRVTLDERHSTRGRANALRLALTGQLGEDGLDGPEMAEALSLCISCKACRRECPMGVDMARSKLEWLHRQNRLHGVGARERVLAALPRVAPRLGVLRRLVNGSARAAPVKRALGLTTRRDLPRFHHRPWRDAELAGGAAEPEAVLFVDTFTRWFEPGNARAAARVLGAGSWAVAPARPAEGGRPLCCGRTWLSAGMLDEARAEAARLLRALAPHARRGAAVVGLEPSCLYTLRDEIPALLPGPDADAVAARAVLLEELLERAWAEGRELPFRETPSPGRTLHVHGHCHQKAFGGMDATLSLLARIPGLEVRAIDAGCCGMAGPFGYHAEHHELSLRMAELALLPAVRAAAPEDLIVADGTSCRAQIESGTGRRAVHAALALAEALA